MGVTPYCARVLPLVLAPSHHWACVVIGWVQVIYDKDRVVLSLPPIINGEHSKVTTA